MTRLISIDNGGTLTDVCIVPPAADARGLVGMVEYPRVWLADFGQPAGSEQGGIRPVVVVASELHCKFPIDMTIVIPVTTRDRGLPHHVAIGSQESGLDRPSWVRTEDIAAISTRRITIGHPLGRLTADEKAAVARWVRRMIAD